MALTYTTLKSAIKDYLQNSETTFENNLANIIVQAENRILKSVQLPDFRKNSTGVMTSGNSLQQRLHRSITLYLMMLRLF